MAVHFPEASEEEKEKKEKENAKRVQELEKEGYDKNFTQYLIDSGYSDEDAKAELDKSVYQADKIKKFQESGLSKEEAMKKCAEDYRSEQDAKSQKDAAKGGSGGSFNLGSIGSTFAKLTGWKDDKEQKAAELEVAKADIEDISANYSVDDVRTNLDFSLKELSNVFGLPYQFDEITDPPVGDGETKIGRIYLEKILTKMPLLVLTPGLPSFMAGESAASQYSIINDLIKGGTEGLGKIDSEFSQHSKYYSLVFAAKEYYKYVNILCHVLASFLGISDQEVMFSDKTTIGDINWGGEALFNRSFATSMSYLGGVAFYVNAETSVSESFSNNTSESVLKSKLNEFSDIGREIQFISGGLGLGPQFGAAKLTEGKETEKKPSGGGMIGTFINNLKSASKTIFAGGKLIFPSLWGDSDYSAPSNSVSIRLTCPDYDKVSWYLNIGVPLMHLIALTAPRQAGPNGYVSPFLCKAFYKGIFNVNMGLIGSLQISKGQEGGWTIDNLPTVVDVQLEIKDLYSKFVISKADFFSDDDGNSIIENTALLTYLGNMAGVNFNVPDLVATFKLWKIIKKQAFVDTLSPASVMYGLSDTAANLISKFAAANIFKFD